MKVKVEKKEKKEDILRKINPFYKEREFFRYSNPLYKEDSWRRPRGLHSKVRRKLEGKPPMPGKGYKKPEEVRGLHPSGYKEVLVYNLKDLEKIDKEREAIRIAATVGKRLREKIIKRAKELGIKILNE